MNTDEPERVMAKLPAFSSELGASMYFDCISERQLEIEGQCVNSPEHYAQQKQMVRVFRCIFEFRKPPP